MGGGNVEALGRLPSTRKTGDQEVWRGLGNITVESLDKVPVEEQRAELVERKGVGHPDCICDAIMEDISVALCGEYMSTFDDTAHHNIDKGLLVAGVTSPKIGGGTVDEPMELVFGDRSIYEAGGKRVPVGEIAEMTVKRWLTENLRFVDRFFDSPQTCFQRKKEIRRAAMDFVDKERRNFEQVRVDVNTLDDETRGEEGMYLTVLGTSAEGADCGQVGRGNKVNGVIALNRPMSTEAAAGKNPVSHVGKIYTFLTHFMADEIY